MVAAVVVVVAAAAAEPQPRARGGVRVGFVCGDSVVSGRWSVVGVGGWEAEAEAEAEEAEEEVEEAEEFTV